MDLIAVSWNECKKVKSEVQRKNIIATCGTTLPGSAHRKRRWTVDDAGVCTTFHVEVPRPQIVCDYFDGAQMIDVHNHQRQGREGVALEVRATKDWKFRFYQSYVGTIEVDSYNAYRRFCPGKSSIKHMDYLRVLTQQLLDNKIGCAPDAPVLRPRPSGDASTGGKGTIRSLQLLRHSKYFIGKTAAAEAIGKKPLQCVLKCRV